MNARSSILLVAIAAFASGLAVDRWVLSPRGDSDEPPAGESGRPGRKSDAKKRSAEDSPRLAGAGGARDEDRLSPDGEDDGDRDRSGGRRDGSDGIPDAVRRELERIERGGHIDAAIVSRILEQIPAGRRRRDVLHHLASRWGRSDPEAALAWAEELSGPIRRSAIEHIIHHWAETDPPGAANYVAQLPGSEQRLHMMHRVGHLWAEQDRAGAIEWGMAQEDPGVRERALGGAVSFWAESDPAAAAEFAASLESPFERSRVLEVAARRWASQDLAEAMEWAHGLPQGDRQRATRSILREVAERDPRRAASIYDEIAIGSPSDGLQAHDQRRMAQEIASVWSSSSPGEAAEWAIALPEAGEVRRAAVADVAEHWLRIDSMAAGEWILQLPEGEVRDGAAERVVGTMVGSNPASAFAWAGSLSDEGHRTGLMREVLNRWRTTDPSAALAALETARVSPDQRRELNEVFEIERPRPPPVPPTNGEAQPDPE